MKSRFSRIDQIFVETEALRHVADLALDLGAPRVMISKPRHVPSPPSGVSNPQSIRIVVVLPLPLGPRKPQIRRARTCRSTLSTTRGRRTPS